jgi:RND family efflux transporter MFP subunit
MRKTILMLLGILLLGSCTKTDEQKTKAPIRVKTEVLSAGAVAGRQTYVGVVEEREATAVSFTSMGVVRRVLVSEGQAVGRGQLIAVLDDTQARNILRGAEAAMAQATDAQARYKMLHDNGSLPEANWVEIQSKVAQAASQLEVAKKNLADCLLRAPVGGIIGRKYISAGETAMPSQAVVNILNISTVKVKVAIPEGEVSGIGPHTPSIIRVEATGGSYEGGRIEKGVQADPLTHTYDIRINVANGSRRLLPGMVASVELGAMWTHAGSQQPTAPVTAVQKRADGSLFVWTVDKDSLAHRMPVAIGETIGNRVVITNGLTGGQRMVVEGYQKLSEGTKVVF